MKPGPKFWWDFKDDIIIVQSDYPGGECLAEFTGDHAIERASSLIRDFESGRKTPNWHLAARAQR